MQKIWNLNLLLINRKDRDNKNNKNEKFNLEIENLISKIDNSINEFKFNVSIALFYETYKVFNNYINDNVSNKSLIDSMTKIMKLMIPFVLI